MQARRRHWKREVGLFLMHLSTMATFLVGLAIGAVYYVDMQDSLDFLFFLTVANLYVYVLAYLYTPVGMAIGDDDDDDEGHDLRQATGSTPSMQGGGSAGAGYHHKGELDVVDIELTPLNPEG